MSFCFTFGEAERAGIISQVYAIEYIEYNFTEKPEDTVLTITGDFFFPNFTKEEKKYYFMHRGDLHFDQRRGDEVIKEDLYTNFLRDLYAPSLSAVLGKDHVFAGLYPGNEKCNGISLKEASMFKIELIDTKIGKDTLLSFYSVDVPPETCAFIRVPGRLENKDLGWLTNGFKEYAIYGGDILLSEVEEKDLDPQRDILKSDPIGYNRVKKQIDQFKETQFVYPARYDIVIWPNSKSRSFRSRGTTDTLTCEYRDIPFYDDRLLTWYRTKSPSFNVLVGRPNNLHIDLEPAGADGNMLNEIWNYR